VLLLIIGYGWANFANCEGDRVPNRVPMRVVMRL